MFAAGVVMLLVGVDAVLVPGYLVLKSVPVTGAGVLVSGLGLVLLLLGLRRPRSPQPQS
jgi:membrane protein implicated in regulation of membrane protease activity